MLHRIRKIHPEIYMKHKRPQIAKAILSKKYNAEGITLSDFKLQSHNHKNTTVLAQKQEEQCLKIDDSAINPLIYSQLIFDKGAKHTMEKSQSFKPMLLGKPDIEN
jgi:hypothetical protein